METDNKIKVFDKGEIAKEWFASMEYDAVKEIEKREEGEGLTDKEHAIIKKHFAHLKTGMFSMVPIKCGGEDVCPFSERCPYVAMKKAPIGDPCPIEKDIAINSTKGYLQEYNIDPIENYSQYKMILMLSRLDVYEMRTVMQLGKTEGATLLQENAIGIGTDGTIAYQTVVNKSFEVLDIIDNKRLRILKLLVGTPQEKYKKDAALKQGNDVPDGAIQLAKLKAATDSILKRLAYKDTQGTTVVDVDVSAT